MVTKKRLTKRERIRDAARTIDRGLKLIEDGLLGIGYSTDMNHDDLYFAARGVIDDLQILTDQAQSLLKLCTDYRAKPVKKT